MIADIIVLVYCFISIYYWTWRHRTGVSFERWTSREEQWQLKSVPVSHGSPHWPLLISKLSISLPWMTCRQSCHSTKEPNLFLAQSWDVDSGIPEGAEGLGWAAAHVNSVSKQKCRNFDELEKRWFSTILEQT